MFKAMNRVWVGCRVRRLGLEFTARALGSRVKVLRFRSRCIGY